MNADIIDNKTFRDFVLSNNIPGYKRTVLEDMITYENDYASAKITFNDFNIIEMDVINKKNGNSEFYLHFQLNTFSHASGLFNEFIDAIKKVKEKKTLRVLLSCSGGLTTSYFAMILNEGAQAIGLDYKFSATAFEKLYHVGKDYDLILLAPQISYKHKEVTQALRHKPIVNIPTSIFASYAVGEMFQLISKTLEAYKNRKKVHLDLPIKKDFHNSTTVLVLGFIRHTDITRIVYRLYDHDGIVVDDEIIKPTLSIDDMCDIIRMMTSQYDIKMIGIVLPGIITEHEVYSESDDYHNIDIKFYFKSQFDIPMIISNDVNAISVGQYITQDESDNICFLFQPRGAVYSGIGNIINGELHLGYNNISGEPFLIEKKFGFDLSSLSTSEDGVIDMVSTALIACICMIGPEKIIYYCDMIPDTNKLVEKIGETIPKRFLPKVEKTIHLKEYMLLGEFYLATKEYEEKKAS